MNIRQRGALQRYLADMDLRADEPRADTSAWHRDMARRIDEIRVGKGYTQAEVRTLIEKHCR
jgi:hypothetical protein